MLLVDLYMLFVLLFDVFFQFGYTLISLIVVLLFFFFVFNGVFSTDSFFLFVLGLWWFSGVWSSSYPMLLAFNFFFFIKVPLLLWWAVQCPLLLFKDFLSYTLFISCWIISWFYLFYILHRILFLLIVWSLLHVLLLA